MGIQQSRAHRPRTITQSVRPVQSKCQEQTLQKQECENLDCMDHRRQARHSFAICESMIHSTFQEPVSRNVKSNKTASTVYEPVSQSVGTIQSKCYLIMKLIQGKPPPIWSHLTRGTVSVKKKPTSEHARSNKQTTSQRAEACKLLQIRYSEILFHTKL